MPTASMVQSGKHRSNAARAEFTLTGLREPTATISVVDGMNINGACGFARATGRDTLRV